MEFKQLLQLDYYYYIFFILYKIFHQKDRQTGFIVRSGRSSRSQTWVIEGRRCTQVACDPVKRDVEIGTKSEGTRTGVGT